VGPGCEHDIGWAEATAVELGLRLALHLGLSERADVKGQPILVRSDNTGVVMAINKGRSRNQPTNVVLKEIYLLQAHHGVHLRVEHVPGQINISDPLSRGDILAFRGDFSGPSFKTDFPLPPHLSDKMSFVTV
jgi:hypothetical protein